MLYKGDALTVLRELPDGSVDAIVTDPPYSSGGAHRADRMQSTRTKYVGSDTATPSPDFAGDNRDQRGYRYWSVLWLTEALRVCRPGGVFAIFTDWRQLPTVTDAIQAGGWVWRGVVVWDKTPTARPQPGFRSQSEYVVWGSRGPLRLDPPVYLPGVLRAPSPKKNRQHQTEKPLGIMESLLRIVPPGGTVLDPFVGSGTTLVAARSTGRKAIGIEIEPAYLSVTADRLGQCGLLAAKV